MADISRQEVQEALKPVLDWYQPDDQPQRFIVDIITDLVSDHAKERQAMIEVQKIVLAARRDCLASAPISALNLANDIISVLGLPSPVGVAKTREPSS